MAKKKNKRPKINPIGVKLAELKIQAACEKLQATAYMIDLASFCLGWEIANGSLGAQLKVKDRIKRDMDLRNKP